MNLKYANNKDYKRINEYFKESGIVYDESDEIIVFEDKQQALIYLMKYEYNQLSNFMLNYNAESDETIGEFILDNLDIVWNDYENGKVYIIG